MRGKAICQMICFQLVQKYVTGWTKGGLFCVHRLLTPT